MRRTQSALNIYFPQKAAVMILLSCLMGQCNAQFKPAEVDLTPSDTVGYGFLKTAGDTLENTAYLEAFFEKLYLQRIEGGRKISILHLGDSHILGNFMTHEVRQRLQNAFGDAGRGLIYPYKIAGSNGPRDFLITSEVRWTGANCVRDLSPQTHFGLSGFSLKASGPEAELTVRLRDTITDKTRFFTKLTVFFHTEADTFPNPEFLIYDPVSGQNADLLLQGSRSSVFYFERPVPQFTLKATAKGLVLDGFSLENELSGVVYHAIGVNGAKFQDFVRAQNFAKQAGELEPDLIILSFGTNEGQAKPDSLFLSRQIDALVVNLHQTCPKAKFLLTTPADSYLRGKGYNPHLEKISVIIRAYARQKGFALWDLYTLSGGSHSARLWKTTGLLSSDSVHYSKLGYIAQGKLFYQSLMSGYNKFAKNIP